MGNSLPSGSNSTKTLLTEVLFPSPPPSDEKGTTPSSSETPPSSDEKVSSSDENNQANNPQQNPQQPQQQIPTPPTNEANPIPINPTPINPQIPSHVEIIEIPGASGPNPFGQAPDPGSVGTHNSFQDAYFNLRNQNPSSSYEEVGRALKCFKKADPNVKFRTIANAQELLQNVLIKKAIPELEQLTLKDFVKTTLILREFSDSGHFRKMWIYLIGLQHILNENSKKEGGSGIGGNYGISRGGPIFGGGGDSGGAGGKNSNKFSGLFARGAGLFGRFGNIWGKKDNPPEEKAQEDKSLNPSANSPKFPKSSSKSSEFVELASFLEYLRKHSCVISGRKSFSQPQLRAQNQPVPCDISLQDEVQGLEAVLYSSPGAKLVDIDHLYTRVKFAFHEATLKGMAEAGEQILKAKTVGDSDVQHHVIPDGAVTFESLIEGITRLKTAGGAEENLISLAGEVGYLLKEFPSSISESFGAATANNAQPGFFNSRRSNSRFLPGRRLFPFPTTPQNQNQQTGFPLFITTLIQFLHTFQLHQVSVVSEFLPKIYDFDLQELNSVKVMREFIKLRRSGRFNPHPALNDIVAAIGILSKTWKSNNNSGGIGGGPSNTWSLQTVFRELMQGNFISQIQGMNGQQTGLQKGVIFGRNHPTNISLEEAAKILADLKLVFPQVNFNQAVSGLKKIQANYPETTPHNILFFLQKFGGRYPEIGFQQMVDDVCLLQKKTGRINLFAGAFNSNSHFAESNPFNPEHPVIKRDRMNRKHVFRSVVSAMDIFSGSVNMGNQNVGSNNVGNSNTNNAGSNVLLPPAATTQLQMSNGINNPLSPLTLGGKSKLEWQDLIGVLKEVLEIFEEDLEATDRIAEDFSEDDVEDASMLAKFAISLHQLEDSIHGGFKAHGTVQPGRRQNFFGFAARRLGLQNPHLSILKELKILKKKLWPREEWVTVIEKLSALFQKFHGADSEEEFIKIMHLLRRIGILYRLDDRGGGQSNSGGGQKSVPFTNGSPQSVIKNRLPSTNKNLLFHDNVHISSLIDPLLHFAEQFPAPYSALYGLLETIFWLKELELLQTTKGWRKEVGEGLKELHEKTGGKIFSSMEELEKEANAELDFEDQLSKEDINGDKEKNSIGNPNLPNVPQVNRYLGSRSPFLSRLRSPFFFRNRRRPPIIPFFGNQQKNENEINAYHSSSASDILEKIAEHDHELVDKSTSVEFSSKIEQPPMSLSDTIESFINLKDYTHHYDGFSEFWKDIMECVHVLISSDILRYSGNAIENFGAESAEKQNFGSTKFWEKQNFGSENKIVEKDRLQSKKSSIDDSSTDDTVPYISISDFPQISLHLKTLHHDFSVSEDLHLKYVILNLKKLHEAFPKSFRFSEVLELLGRIPRAFHEVHLNPMVHDILKLRHHLRGKEEAEEKLYRESFHPFGGGSLTTNGFGINGNSPNALMPWSSNSDKQISPLKKPSEDLALLIENILKHQHREFLGGWTARREKIARSVELENEIALVKGVGRRSGLGQNALSGGVDSDNSEASFNSADVRGSFSTWRQAVEEFEKEEDLQLEHEKNSILHRTFVFWHTWLWEQKLLSLFVVFFFIRHWYLRGGQSQKRDFLNADGADRLKEKLVTIGKVGKGGNNRHHRDFCQEECFDQGEFDPLSNSFVNPTTSPSPSALNHAEQGAVDSGEIQIPEAYVENTLLEKMANLFFGRDDPSHVLLRNDLCGNDSARARYQRRKLKNGFLARGNSGNSGNSGNCGGLYGSLSDGSNSDAGVGEQVVGNSVTGEKNVESGKEKSSKDYPLEEAVNIQQTLCQPPQNLQNCPLTGQKISQTKILSIGSQDCCEKKLFPEEIADKHQDICETTEATTSDGGGEASEVFRRNETSSTFGGLAGDSERENNSPIAEGEGIEITEMGVNNTGENENNNQSNTVEMDDLDKLFDVDDIFSKKK